MLRRADQPITAEEIYEEVWGECNGQEKTVVSTTMQRLRTKIEKDPANPTFILNVRGYGYKLASRGAVLAEVARQA